MLCIRRASLCSVNPKDISRIKNQVPRTKDKGNGVRSTDQDEEAGHRTRIALVVIINEYEMQVTSTVNLQHPSPNPSTNFHLGSLVLVLAPLETAVPKYGESSTSRLIILQWDISI